jgi:antitoxin MazE
MKTMQITIRQIGNSKGVVIPKPLLVQAGLFDVVDVTVEGDAIVLRRPAKAARTGWADAARRLAAQRGDERVMGEFANESDSDLTW